MRIKMFSRSLAFLFVLASNNCLAQTANWAFHTGGTADESSIYNMSDASKDNSGNVYHGGVFESSLMDVDPSGAVVNLTNSGGRDGYFAKYSPSGNLIWAVKIGGSQNDGVNNVATDNSGNVYVTGFFGGTVDFDPSATVYNLTATSAGQAVTGDIFLAKYNSSGQFQWAFSYGGGTGYDYGWSLAVTPAGTVYVGGIITMTGNLDVDPSSAVFNLSVTGGNAFCVKYNTNGQFVNAFNIGAAYQNSCIRKIKPDTNGDLYIGGYIKGNCDIDPSAGVSNIISNSEDPFVMKLDTNFNFYWGFNIRTNNQVDEGFSISLDQNNVYFSGYVAGNNIDFDPSSSNTSLNSAGGSDNFIASYTKSGQYRWARVIGGVGDEWNTGNAQQGSNVAICGFFSGTVDFDPSPVSFFNLTSYGGRDGYCLKLDTNGLFKCAFQVGGTGDDHIHSIWFYAPGKMVMNGTFHNTVHIPEPAGVPITSSGGFDLFLADVDWPCAQCTISYAIDDTVVACKTVQFFPINNGGDTAVQFSWNFGDGNTSSLPEPSHVYLTTGVFNVSLVVVDSSGCKDSLNKQVIINSPDYSIQPVVNCKQVSFAAVHTGGSICSQFNWNFGDGSGSTVQNPVHVYSTNGVFNVSLVVVDSTGCTDSTTSQININTPIYSVSDTVSCKQASFFGVHTGGSIATQFSWNFGDGNTSVLQNPVHAYSGNGVYNIILVVTDGNGCHDTATKQISVSSPDYFIQDTLTNCKQVLFLGVYSSGSTATQFLWNFGDGVSVTGNPATHSYSNSGSYTASLTIVDSLGCSSVVTIHVSFPPDPVFEVMPDHGIFCRFDSVSLSAAGGDTYEWYPALNISNASAANPIVYPDSSITYHVIITDTTCNITDTLAVNLTIAAKPNVSIVKSDDINCLHSSVTITASGGVKYNWMPSPYLQNLSDQSQTVSPLTTTSFSVVGENEFGCKDTAAIVVLVKNEGNGVAYFPNAFTPDGNGLNDCWTVRITSQVENMHVSVFNRWGNKVFETYNIGQCWDGTYKGQLQSTGTYFYYYEASSPACGSFSGKGDFELIR